MAFDLRSPRVWHQSALKTCAHVWWKRSERLTHERGFLSCTAIALHLTERAFGGRSILLALR